MSSFGYLSAARSLPLGCTLERWQKT